MKTFLFLLFLPVCLLYSLGLSAQLNAQFNDYREQQSLLNPAAIFNGYNNYHNLYVGLSYREQGFGLSNQSLKPANFLVKGTWIAKSPVANQFKALVGASILTRQIGPMQINRFNLKIGAINLLNRTAMPILEKSILSLALNFSLNQIRIQSSQLKGLVIEDPLLQSNYTQIVPNMGFGLYYKSPIFPNKWKVYGGIGVPQLFAWDLRNLSVLDAKILQNLQPSIYGQVGFQKYHQNDNFLELTIWRAKEPQLAAFYDISMRYYLGQQHFWFGAGISSKKIMHTQLGFAWYQGWSATQKKAYKAKQPILRCSIGYDFTIGQFNEPLKKAFELNIYRLINVR